MRILVVGCGSIGERHIRNISELQVEEIIACDLKQDKLSEMKHRYGVREDHTNFEQALSKKPDDTAN